MTLPRAQSRREMYSRLRRGVLVRRDPRHFWIGETTSKLGSTVSTVALPLVAVVTLHASPFLVSLLSAAAWLPWLLIGLPVGAWVDRLSRRRVMLSADAASLVLFASIPIAAWLGALSLAQLLAVAFLGGAASVWFQTAYQVYLPSLVHPGELAAANALVQGSESAAQVAGPGVAGVLSALFGAVSGVLIDAVSFLVSAVCLLSIRATEPHPDTALRRRALHREVAEGLRFVTRDPYLSVLTIWGGLSNFALAGYQSILIVFLIRVVRVGPGVVGVLIALISLGGVIGAAIATRVGRRLGTARGFLICELSAAPAALLIPLTGPGPRLACLVAGGMLVGTGVVAGNVLKGSWRQTYCPRKLLGRVVASSQFLNYGAIPLGALTAGALATTLGIPTSLWIMTTTLALSPLVLLLGPIRRHRELPDSPRPSTPPRFGEQR